MQGIDAGWIQEHLCQSGKMCRIKYFHTIPSTNATAKAMARDGAEHGLVVIANTQTAGRGRMERRFFSPDATGLYMSVLVRRQMKPGLATRLTTAAAVCTARAIESLSGRRAEIKWVNDIYMDGKKVCGILTEAALTLDGAALDHAVIGIGVNVYLPEQGFPDEISEVAGAVLGAQHLPQARERLAADILQGLFDVLEDIEQEEIYLEYCRRSCLLGKTVRVSGGVADGCLARVVGIDTDFRLIVRLENGDTVTLDSGEVSVKKK